MPDNQALDKLTPAAHQVLQEMVGEFSEELLARAERNASTPSGEVREITVRDLLYAADQIRGRETYRKSSTVDSSYFAILGLVIAFTVSMMGLAASDVGASNVLLPVIAIAGSLVALITTIVFGRLRRIRLPNMYEVARRDLAADYLGTWIDFETFIRAVGADVLGDTVATQPIGHLFEKLSDVGIMRESEVAEVRRLLDIRNQVAHTGRNIDQEDLLDAARTLLRIREAILDRH